LASPLVREMLDAGIHFGHHSSRWNPKMGPYIYGQRNRIHIVDIRETLRGLLRAQRFLTDVVRRGEDILFVGTKRQAREAVREQADRCGMPYVVERWLGGTLTNFRTIRSRLKRLEELEALVQSPEWETSYSKKMKSILMRELRKIRRNLGGIRNMTKLPGAVVTVDVRKEINALREADALNIPTICLIDTDGDPDLVSLPIPGNDDSMRGTEIVITRLADAVEEGKRARPEPTPQKAEAPEASVTPAPRRARRTTSAAAGSAPPTSGPDEAATAVGVADAHPDPEQGQSPQPERPSPSSEA
jgi:small subunit ribosomal protein S2